MTNFHYYLSFKTSLFLIIFFLIINDQLHKIDIKTSQLFDWILLIDKTNILFIIMILYLVSCFMYFRIQLYSESSKLRAYFLKLLKRYWYFLLYILINVSLRFDENLQATNNNKFDFYNHQNFWYILWHNFLCEFYSWFY